MIARILDEQWNLVEELEAEPERGLDFCFVCGDCLATCGDEDCQPSGGLHHWLVSYDEADEFRARVRGRVRQSEHALDDPRRFASLVRAALLRPVDPGVPMPGHCDPSYHRHEPVLREALERGEDVFLLPVLPAWTLAPDPYPTSTAWEREVLTRRTCAAPAPYVGRPFVYRWDAWVSDGDTAAVAGPARVQHTVDLAAWTALYGYPREDPFG